MRESPKAIHTTYQLETTDNTRGNDPGNSNNWIDASKDKMGDPQAYRPKHRFGKVHGQASTT
jgi:hypothetical protein